MQAQPIGLDLLVEAEWNANRVSKSTLAKVRRSLETFGVVENLVARPHPELLDRFEVLSGNHRLRLLRELGYESAPVVVVELDDAAARVLAQTLNRARGVDDPNAYAALLERVLRDWVPDQVTEFLPETESSLERRLREYRGEPELDDRGWLMPSEHTASKPGEVYELGPHRLLCGDATDREQVERLIAGERVAVMVTDPPYGVGVDHSWRDGKRQPLGAARTATLLNDDRVDWRQAWLLSPAPVAYVWHAALQGGLVEESLAVAGYRVRQQIVWVKTNHALGRADYHWRHETCWYATRPGPKRQWFGGRDQSTVWEAASPIAAFGGGTDDVTTSHPTQKPLQLFEQPILNHSKRGDVVYDPFAGSGTALVAAEKHGRRALLVELDPGWCDVIRSRYELFVKEAAR